VYQNLLALQPVNNEVEKLRAQITAQREKNPADAAKLDAFTQKLEAFAGAGGRRRRGNQQAATLSSVRGSSLEIFSVLQDADVTPTPLAAQAVETLNQSTQRVLKQWNDIQKNDLPQLKSQLHIKSLPQVDVERGSSEGINQDED